MSLPAVSAFRGQRPFLLNLIRHCLPTLTNSLHAKGMISRDVYEIASNDSKEISKRGVALLDCIETRLQVYPADLAKLVELLEAEPFLRSLAKDLLQSYSECLL